MSSDTQRQPTEPEAEMVVDLLEIYHARRLRNAAAAQVQRLRRQHRDGFEPIDESNLVELGCYYEALQLSLDQLLLALGDHSVR